MRHPTLDINDNPNLHSLIMCSPFLLLTLVLSREHFGIWSVFWAGFQIMGGVEKDKGIT